MEDRAGQVERAVIKAFQFVPAFARTYTSIAFHPRSHFRSLRADEVPPGTVSPAAFWLTNTFAVLVCKVLMRDPDAPSSLQDLLDVTGVVLGTGMLAAYLAAILDLLKLQHLVAILRVVFSASVTFVPAFFAARWSWGPHFVEDCLGWLVFGTPWRAAWYQLLILPVNLGVYLGYFLVLGLGIRTLFGKSRTCILVCLLTLPAFAVTATAIDAVARSAAAVWSTGLPMRELTRARTAMAQRPPDYTSASQALEGVVSSDSSLLTRQGRIAARIGQAATQRAMWAWMRGRGHVESKFRDSAMQALGKDNESAAKLLFEGVTLMRQDPVLAAMAGEQDDDLKQIRLMMANDAYEPPDHGKAEPAAPTSTLRFPWPRLLP